MHGYFIIIKYLNFQLCIQIHQKLKLESNPFSPTCAGKTTLRRSMARSLEKGVGAHFIPLVEIIELRKPFKCCFNDPNDAQVYKSIFMRECILRENYIKEING
jgi:stage III sporulation protein SpoIIIAA